MSGSPITIVCGANAAYAMPLAVAARSALDNLRPSARLNINVLDAGLTSADRERLLASWQDPRVQVRFVEAPNAWGATLPIWGRMATNTYDRLRLGTLLPELDRVLWLDCDMVVLGDLAELWDATPGPLVWAVQDMAVPYLRSPFGVARWRELRLPGEAPYFNAGLMLVDLAKWRAEDIESRALDYLRRNPRDVHLWDQEALNAVLVGRWQALDPTWNQISSLAGRAFFRPVHLDEASHTRTARHPRIVHYAGTFKPWLVPHAPTSATYFDYLDRTAWAGWRPRLTPTRLALSVYLSALRPLVYRLELPLLRLQRRLTLRRS